MPNLFLLFVVLIFYSFSSYGKYSPSLTSSFAIVNLEISENASSLEQTDTSVASSDEKPESASFSVLSLEVNYEIPFSRKYSYFYKGVVPLITSDGSGLFAGHVGMNWYLNGFSSQYVIELDGSEVKLKPTLQYYVGASTGLGYSVYNTISAKKSDVFFDIGLHAGGTYHFKKEWGIKGELNVGRGTGVTTSNINTKLTLGLTWYI